jgi:elongation factor G
VSEVNPQTRPVMSVAISAKNARDRESLQRALSTLAQQDPSITVGAESISGQTIISGMGELHLELFCARILREYGMDADVGRPTVIYLETLRDHAEAEGKYIRQIGACANYGHVKIRLEPNKTGEGVEFINDIKDGAVPSEYFQPTEQGIREALQDGVLAGYEVAAVKATLLDGSYHLFDSNEMAFRIAGSMACKEAMRKASPVLLEPVMAVEVGVPEDYIGMTIEDLNARRGRIEGIERRGDSQVVKASVPLSELLGYANYLRSSTHGQCDHSIRYTRHEEAPPRSDWGGDGPGVTSNKPTRPRGFVGSSSAKLDEEFD